MKIAIIVISIIVLVSIVAVGCRLLNSRNTAATIPVTAKLPGKAVIVYFSQSKVQNTALVAKWILKHVGGELIEVIPVNPYPDAYSETLKEASRERKEGTPREIQPISIPDDCEIVFIGSPIWYGTFAPPIATFLKANPLAGKTVVPFCTHGGGGAERFEQDVQAACPEAKVLKGFVARGSNQIERRLDVGVPSHHKEDDVITWLNGIF
ncbi:MAG: hypothetical protein IKZ46_08815 [Victivallales bacterium]|nr:hypothetical protein [Victivallales bacterium]